MKQIPLNLLSLYEDVSQRKRLSEVAPASISRKIAGGKRHLYAVVKDGSSRRQIYIGPEDSSEALAKAEQHRRATREQRDLKTAIQALRRAGIAGPGIEVGQVLEVIANEGLFDRGLVLAGTVAYQLYPCVIGAFLPDGSARTQVADFSIARFAIAGMKGAKDFAAILKRADPTFEPRWSRDDKLPKAFVSERGLVVELLTARGRDDKPVPIPDLGAAAQPLRFMEYLLADPIDVVALYDGGVVVRVPDPARFAIHKLLIHQVRGNRVKAEKDLWQARELIGVLRARDPALLDNAISDCEGRGRVWRKMVRDGLEMVEAAERP